MRPSATTLEPEITDAELAAMLRALHVAPLRGPHLEIGTAAGGTLRALMLTYSAEHRPQFVVVDPMTYFPDQLSIVRRNLASAGIDPDSVEFRISKSWPAFQRAKQSGERFSFIFIDASHKAHRVMQDICWARLLEPGGLLCFHDYAPRFPGVMFAVGRLLSANENYEIVEQTESMLILRKAVAGKPEVRRRDLIAAQFVNLGHQIAAGVRRRIGRTRFRDIGAPNLQ